MSHFTVWQTILLVIITMVRSDTSDCLRSALTCSDMLFTGQIWGYNVKGLLIGEYTGNLQFLGCIDTDIAEMTSECNDLSDFSCTDSGTGITIDSSPKQMLSLFGTGILPTTDTGCATESNMRGFSGLVKEKEILCPQLGYEFQVGAGSTFNPPQCTGIKWDNKTNSYFLDFIDVEVGFYNSLKCGKPCISGTPTETPTQNPTISTQTPTISTQTPTISTQNPTISTQTPTISTETPTISSQNPSTESINPTTGPTVSFDSDSDSSESDSSESLDSNKNTFIAGNNVLKHEINGDENDVKQNSNNQISIKLDGYTFLGLVLLIFGCCSVPFVWFFITKKSNII